MTTAPIEIGDDLRSLILRYRRNPERWPGHKRGLTQAEAAKLANISTAWWRQIENGYVISAGAVTLADICTAIDIEIDLVRGLGYVKVADAMETQTMLTEKTIPDRLLNFPHGKRPVKKTVTAEAHIKATPDLDNTQIDLLLQTLKQIRRKREPLGKDLWHRAG